MICDETHPMLESYGVWGLKKFMGREYMGISRVTYIIDSNGVKLQKKSDQLKKKLIIFHEMRYTSFFQKVYEIVNSGKLGDLITVEHRENVVYWHYAHSFVRGTWRNTRDSAPFILAKCCHDLDLLFWIIGQKVNI